MTQSKPLMRTLLSPRQRHTQRTIERKQPRKCEGRDDRCKPWHLFWLPTSLSLFLLLLLAVSPAPILLPPVWYTRTKGSGSNSIQHAAKINERQKETEQYDWAGDMRPSGRPMHFLTACSCFAIWSTSALTNTNSIQSHFIYCTLNITKLSY